MPSVMAHPATQEAYPSGLDYLDDELRLLDLLLLRAAATAPRPGLEGHQGLYVSREEVELLLDPQGRTSTHGGWAGDEATAGDTAIDELRAAIDRAVAASGAAGVRLPLRDLTARLGLSETERRALIVCLAPELDRKYDRVYAYLQDDLARQRPSVDLVARLVAGTRHGRWRALRTLSPHGLLLRSGMLQTVEDPTSPSGSSALAQMLQVAAVVVGHVLGDSRPDLSLAGVARLVAPAPGSGQTREDRVRVARLVRLVGRHDVGAGGLVVHLHGPYGAGQADTARALAGALGTSLIEVDCRALPADPGGLADAVEAAMRDGWLYGVPVLLLDADRVLSPPQGWTRAQVFDAALTRFPGRVLLAAERPWPGPATPRGCALHEIRFEPPGPAVRRAAWTRMLGSLGMHAEDGWPQLLAEQFRLTVGQIHDVVDEVHGAAVALDRDPDLDAWRTACRRRLDRDLDALSQRVPAARTWDDLVLDADRCALLHEICDQVRLRGAVLDGWGLGRRAAAVARGLTVLFAGPPGTGKSMAAEVVAHELALDLYRIDLSQIVSKYIGETEKHLARVFAAAEDSGAVLLFDEADALFGRRTEIADAHDRYANIETSYLLQRMEAYDGIAVLSTNLRRNLDDAFLRRLRFVVEFPLPDAERRQQIWARHLGDVPLDDDVDLAALAHRLAVSGGSIRNIVLAAAFLAAAERVPVGMTHLMRAARREFDKIGKLWRDPAAPAGRQA